MRAAVLTAAAVSVSLGPSAPTSRMRQVWHTPRTASTSNAISPDELRSRRGSGALFPCWFTFRNDVRVSR